MRLMRKMLLLLVAVAMLSVAAAAQYDTGAVLGTVTDPAGGVVAGSKLTLKNVATGVTAERKSNASGEFEFTGVLPGDYTLTTESQNFKSEQTQFSVAVGARQRVDMKLAIGATDTVTVTDAAAQLETDSSDNGFTVQPREVNNLPLNGREYADLAKLAPGVHQSTIENESTTSRDASYNVNGLRSSWNNFILDGLDNNSYGVDNQGFSNQAIQPVLDAVNEFRVTTDNYSAEYGKAGGAVVNAATKSGTSQFHGAAWDYIRNPAANAVGPFPLTPGSVPGPQQNQFGGVFGGPLPLHFLTRRGKTFFFADFEAVRRVQHAPLTATVPTAAQLTALLSGTTPFYDSVGNVIPLVNPYTTTYATSATIPGGIITPAILAQNPLAKIVLTNFVGVANQPGTAVASSNLTSNPAATLNSNKGDGRFDWAIDEKQTFFVRYSSRAANVVDPSPIPPPNYGKSNGNTYQANQQIASGYTLVLTPNSALDARLGFTWSQANRKPFNLGGDNLLVDAGIPNAPTDPAIAGGLNTQAVTGFSATWGRSASTPTSVNPFAIDPKVNYSLLHGKHSLKFGYEYQHVSIVVSNTHPQDGTDTYKGLFTEGKLKAATINGVADPAYKQAWALADFVFGARSQYELSNQTVITEELREHAAYAQDDWRALPNLTLNMGLRYEFAAPTWELNNQLSNFSPAAQNLILASNGSMYNRGLVNPNWANFGPRFGFSWSVAPKTVLRGGFGISFQQFNRVAGGNELSGNLPVSIDTVVAQLAPTSKSTPTQALCTGATPLPASDIGTCFVSTQQGYPNSLIAPSTPVPPFNLLNNNPTYVPAHTPTTYVQSFQLNVQRELAKDLTFSVAYVGNTGVHELLLADYNQAAVNNAAGSLSLQARRPINTTLCCGDVSMAINEGNSNYNSLQTKLEKRYGAGLYVVNSFTWSHAIDLASGHLEDGAGDTEYVNLYDIAGDRGRSAYDQPLNETLAITYDLPYGKGRKYGSSAPYLLQLVAGGWQTSIINAFNSGLTANIVYTPTAAQSVDATDLASYYRPNIIGNPVLQAPAHIKTATYVQYLNPAAISVPTANNAPFGNAARNIVRAPNYDTVDMSVHKRFALWSEASALELRVDSFNTMNRANLQAPSDTNASDIGTTYGQITTAYPARELQGAIKIIF